jgi:peptidoglycan/LPS O-acetylase OafA/YrhL
LWTALLIALVTGVLLGGVNSLSNVLGSPYGPHALQPYEGVFFLEVLAAVIGTAWAWALVAFGLGWWSTTRSSAALMGVLALAIAALVYYVSDHAFGLNDELETGEMAYWMAMSMGVGSVFGLLGHLARRPRWWSLLPGLTAPFLVVMVSYPAGSDHIQPWPERVAWIVAVALTIAITSRWLRMQRRSQDASP